MGRIRIGSCRIEISKEPLFADTNGTFLNPSTFHRIWKLQLDINVWYDCQKSNYRSIKLHYGKKQSRNMMITIIYTMMTMKTATNMMIMVTVINSGDSGDNGADCDDCDGDDCADDHDNDDGHPDDISLWTWCSFPFSRWCAPESSHFYRALFMVASMTPTTMNP